MRNREIKYWGLRTLNIIIVTYFDVFLCFWEWIHRFSRVFWLLLFDSCQSLHKRQHRNTAGGPDLVYSKAVCGPYLITIMIFSVRRPQYFISHTKSQRLLVTRHRLPCEKVNLHITLVKWVWEACGHTKWIVCDRRSFFLRGIFPVLLSWDDAGGFYWKYTTMQCYKLCGQLIPFNMLRSSKVVAFVYFGNISMYYISAYVSYDIHCKLIFISLVCALYKSLNHSVPHTSWNAAVVAGIHCRGKDYPGNSMILLE